MQNVGSTGGFARLLRQIFFIPSLHGRWLSPTVKDKLATVIAQAEQGHLGEIYLIIESHLPIYEAYHTTCKERALQLFASHNVWDTEYNTGILVYLNLCEHDLEIVADRGIDKKAHTLWEPLCHTALTCFKQGDMQGGLMGLIESLGELLLTHYPSDKGAANELSNHPLYLK